MPQATHIDALEDLANVTITSPTDGQGLTWDGTAKVWKNSNTGSSGAPVDATYIVASSNKTLTNESVLTAGDGVAIVTESGTTTISANVAAGSGIAQTTSKGTITTALNIHGLTAKDPPELTDEVPIYDGGNKRVTLGQIVDLAAAGTTTPTITIETITEGEAGTPAVPGENEQQIVEFQGGPSGSIAVTFGGQTATFSDVTTDIEASNVDTALEALSSIGASNLTCTDSGSGGLPRDVTIEFVGDLAEASQSLLTLAPTLTPGTVELEIAETTAGSAGTNAIDETGLVAVWDMQASTPADTRPNLMTTGVGGLVPDPTDVDTNSGANGQDVIFTGGTSLQATISAAVLSGGDFTVSMLVKRQTSSTLTLIWSSGEGADWQFKVLGDNKLRLEINSEPSGDALETSATIPTGEWVLCVARWDASASELALSINGATPQTTTGTLTAISGTEASVTLTSSAQGADEIDEICVWSRCLSNSEISDLYAGGAFQFYPDWDTGSAGTSEVQTLTLSGSPTWGTFTLTHGGNTTSALAHNANAETVQTALRALSGLSAVTCSGTLGGGMTVTYPSSMGNVGLLTINQQNLLVRVRRLQAGQAGVDEVPGDNEVQRITIENAGSGTFLLDHDGTEIGPIDWDADAAAMQTAFDDASVDATVTGANPFDVEFTGANAETDVAELTADASGLGGTPAVGRQEGSFSGNGSQTSFDMVHGLGKKYVSMSFWITDGTLTDEACEIERWKAISTTTARAIFSEPLPSGTTINWLAIG